MKIILYVIQNELVGGVLLRILRITKHLNTKKYKPIVVLPHGDAANLFREAGIDTYEVNIKRLRQTLNPCTHFMWLYSIIPSVKALIKIIKDNDVDLVYANQITQIHGPLAAYISNTKLIWHLIALHMPSLVEKAFVPLVKLTADRVVVSSDARGVQLRQSHGLSKETTTIHAPVDVEKFVLDNSGNNIKNEFNLKLDDLIIGIIGNLSPVKGVEYFLEAASIVRKTNPKVKFMVIGAVLETQKKYFHKIQYVVKELKLESDVIFTGRRKDIPELLAAIDILVVSSISESSPLVVLEGMAAAKPIVATQVGGIPEQIVDGKTGILIPPKDSQAIADAILNLLSDKDKMRKMGNAGRKRVKECFDIDICVDRVERMFEEVLGNDNWKDLT